MMLSYLIFRIAWDFKIIIFERMFSVSSKPSLEYILLENNYFRNIALIIKHILNNIIWSGLHKNTYPIIGRVLKDVTQFWNHWGHNSEHSLLSILLMTLIHLYLKSASFVKDLKGFIK